MWTIKTTANFSFSKLLRKLPKIIEDSLEDICKDSANTSKKNIYKVKHGVPLRTSTKIARSEGFYVNNKRVTPTRSTTPLKYTETLYNSIKGDKKGLYMEHYGILHHEGDSRDGVATRPKREFIEVTMSEETEKELYENIKRAIKK